MGIFTYGENRTKHRIWQFGPWQLPAFSRKQKSSTLRSRVLWDDKNKKLINWNEDRKKFKEPANTLIKETQKQSKYIIWLVQSYKSADGEWCIFNKKTRCDIYIILGLLGLLKVHSSKPKLLYQDGSLPLYHFR